MEVTSAVEPVNDPIEAPEAPLDDFDKKFGLTSTSPTGRENRIPYSRVKKITEKAVTDAKLVAKAGADGAHLPDIAEFQAALATLKPERIAGCGGLETRHDAMSAAEGGADYVMFGEPDADGERPSFDAVLERIAWWAEVFEIPCVGFAGAANEIEPLVAAGADFIALGEWVFDDVRGAAQAIAEAAQRLVQPETVG